MKGRRGGQVTNSASLTEFSWNFPQGAQKINVQTSQELRTNFLVTTYKLPEIPGSLYVRTNLLKFQEACTYTYKLTKISVSLYVRTNLLNVQTYSNIYTKSYLNLKSVILFVHHCNHHYFML